LVAAVRPRCELASYYPLDQQRRAIQTGLAAANHAGKLAVDLGDLALQAFLTRLKAIGHHALGELSPSRQGFAEAVAIYSGLALTRPEVYQSQVAQTLSLLGNLQREFNEPVAAGESLTEALAIRRNLAQTCPEAYQVDVATTLSNLGNVRRELNDLEGARDCHLEALASLRKLARGDVEMYREDITGTLNNLGMVQLDLNQHENALNSFTQALDSYCEIERSRPEIYQPYIAGVLLNLDVHFATRSSVLIDLDYSGSLWERGSSCTKITLGPQERGCSPCRCLSRTLFVCPIHSVPNSRP